MQNGFSCFDAECIIMSVVGFICAKAALISMYGVMQIFYTVK